MNQIVFLIYVVLLALCFQPVVQAEPVSGLNLSVRLVGGTWTGNNVSEGQEFNSEGGGQLGMSIGYQSGRFYSGLNIQGGEYTFGDRTPDQVTTAGSTQKSDDTITRNELDIVFGYYLSQQFSVFIDLKGTSNEWQSNGYLQEYSALGIGVAGYWPVNSKMLLHGSFGATFNGQVSHEGNNIGEGKSAGLDVGGLYTLSNGHRLMFGIKSSTYEYEFDNGAFQRHVIAGLYLGYNYAFSMD